VCFGKHFQATTDSTIDVLADLPGAGATSLPVAPIATGVRSGGVRQPR
jgi:hypothetical protein